MFLYVDPLPLHPNHGRLHDLLPYLERSQKPAPEEIGRERDLLAVLHGAVVEDAEAGFVPNSIKRIFANMISRTTKGKELGLKEFKIHMGLFDYSVIGVIGDYKKMSEYIAWKFDEKDFDSTHWDMGYEPRGKCFHRAGYVPIIWLPREPKTPRERATFAHEALHAVYHLFQWANLPMTRDTEELAGHSLAHIITNLFSRDGG